jgi:branched-subunit amino acid aminotransferase/4-amino-4-deoxychorismate lyase
MPDELASLDGVIAPSAETTIPATEEGFLRGDGVFEVIRVYDGVPFALQDHLTRLERSTKNLRLGWSASKDELKNDIARLLDGVKSLSYAANMLATRSAKERGFDEALLVTPHGRVLEAPTSTLFWCTGDGILATPPLDEHILASITRAYVIEVTGAEERICTKEELEQAGEAFLASTTREVQPVTQIEEIELKAPGKRTSEAAEGLRARIQEALAAGG